MITRHVLHFCETSALSGTYFGWRALNGYDLTTAHATRRYGIFGLVDLVCSRSTCEFLEIVLGVTDCSAIRSCSFSISYCWVARFSTVLRVFSRGAYSGLGCVDGFTSYWSVLLNLCLVVCEGEWSWDRGYQLKVRAWGGVTKLCVRVPFYRDHYVCYNFCDAASLDVQSSCISTLYGRVGVHPFGATASCSCDLEAVCLKNKAPDLLGRSRLVHLFRNVGRTCFPPSRPRRRFSGVRVAVRYGPSSISRRFYGALLRLPMGEMDVKTRAFSSRHLNFLRHHRGTTSIGTTVGELHNVSVRGVDVSLVFKFPNRALRS